MNSIFKRQGPKVFISYSFGNTLAADIKRKMDEHGFQTTLLDDSTLLGEGALELALDERISAAEVLVPVIDARAARPDARWLSYEWARAKQRGLVIIPVVEDGVVPPAMVSEIPYAHAGNWESVVPAIARHYARVPLDVSKPFQLHHDQLTAYLSTPHRFVRVILDSDGLAESWRQRIPSEVERLTVNQPEVRKPVEAQCLRMVNRISRNLDLLDPLIPRFRRAMEDSLQSYRAERLARMLPGWQRAARLILGSDVMLLARSGLDLWGEANETAESELDQFRQAADQGHYWLWAAKCGQSQPVERWLDVCFVASGRIDFRGFIPLGNDTRDMVRCQSQPLNFFEKYQWADYGLPQLLHRAVNYADRTGNSTIGEQIAWDLEEYSRSGLP